MNERIAEILAKLPDASAATAVVQAEYRKERAAAKSARTAKAAAKYRRRHPCVVRIRGRKKVDFAAEILLNTTACAYCDVPLAAGEVTLDHVKPLSKGGWHENGNVVGCCRRRNSSKGNRTDWVPPNKRILSVDD